MKKILTFFIVLVMINSTAAGCNKKMISATSDTYARKPVKVGVLINNLTDANNILTKNSFEDIQKENDNKIQFTFFDGKANPAIETQILDNMLQDSYDLILASLVDKREPELIEQFVYKAKQKNTPIIFFNITPSKLNLIKNYSKSLIINTDTKQAAILQGKMIADAWNNKDIKDKNNDGIMEYIMLKGQAESYSTEARSKYSILTINDAGIQTKELGSVFANWDKELAKNAMDNLFLRYGGNVEAIIANNDSMAIGAVEALQKYGYNMGDKEKTIPVFGINGTAEAEDLIKKGFMAGSVPQNQSALADALYTVGMNLVSGKYPLEGTNYTFDETGVIVLISLPESISEK